jgi:hypothetical protein
MLPLRLVEAWLVSVWVRATASMLGGTCRRGWRAAVRGRLFGGTPTEAHEPWVRDCPECWRVIAAGMGWGVGR